MPFSEKMLEAVKYGLSGDFAKLVDHEATGRDELGSLLHYAALHGNLDVAREMLHRGSPVDEMGPNGRTPLAIAVEESRISVVRMLLDAGADIAIVCRRGQTPLSVAIQDSKVDHRVLKYLVNHLEVTLAMPTEQLVETIIQAGCSLYCAARLDKIEIVIALLARGYDVNSRGENGKSALHACAETNGADIARLLVAHGADVNLTDTCSKSAVFYASIGGNLQTLSFLLDQAALVNSEDSRGETPLLALASKWYINNAPPANYTECAMRLLKCGAQLRTGRMNSIEFIDRCMLNKNTKLLKVFVAQMVLSDDINLLDERLTGWLSRQYEQRLSDAVNYYTQCSNKLEEIIFNNLSLRDMLSDHQDIMRNRARHQLFGVAIEAAMLDNEFARDFQYYRWLLMLRAAEAAALVELENQAEPIIQRLLNIHNIENNVYLEPARIVARFLVHRDLENVINV